MTLGAPPTIVPENSDRGLFALGLNGWVEVFTQFSANRVVLEQHLAQPRWQIPLGVMECIATPR
jgi:hypothetical protein